MALDLSHVWYFWLLQKFATGHERLNAVRRETQVGGRASEHAAARRPALAVGPISALAIFAAALPALFSVLRSWRRPQRPFSTFRD